MKLFRSKSEKNKEPYEEFVATVKLVSGEEILTKVIIDYSSKEEQIIIDNPVVCQEVRSHGANIPMGYKFEPWMKLTDEEVFIVDMNRIITMSEIRDKEVNKTYSTIIKQGFARSHPEITKEMGYINSVNEARRQFEEIYKKDSKDTKET